MTMMMESQGNITIDIKGDLGVYIGIPVNRDFPWQTTKSLIDTVARLESERLRYTVQFIAGGSQIDHVRSFLANRFLETDHNRLFWIDSDMEWSPDQFMRLLALSMVHPIVGCTYSAKRDEEPKFQVDFDSPLVPDRVGCIEMKGFGLGFTVCHREVIEKLAEMSPKCTMDGKDYFPMTFRTGIGDDGVYRSEDMHFFHDCRNLGYKVMLDPMTDLGHVGCKVYRGRFFGAMKKVG